jgi:hypothetical protein
MEHASRYVSQILPTFVILMQPVRARVRTLPESGSSDVAQNVHVTTAFLVSACTGAGSVVSTLLLQAPFQSLQC